MFPVHRRCSAEELGANCANFCLVRFKNMDWVSPHYSRGEVDRAGAVLIMDRPDPIQIEIELTQ